LADVYSANGFFFFDVYPRYRYEDIDVLDFRVCYNGEWYNTRFVPPQLIERILNSSRVDGQSKTQLQKWSPPKVSCRSTTFSA
jgi:hypothetical protein